MNIYSTFGDYYDNMLPYDNEGINWCRNTTDFILDSNKRYYFSKDTTLLFTKIINDIHSLYPLYKDTVLFVLGFCGKLRLCFINRTFDKKINRYNINFVTNDFDKYKSKFNIYNDVYKYIYKYNRFDSFIYEFINFLNNVKDIDKYFIDINSPIFILKNQKVFDRCKDEKLIVNPELKKYKLQSIIDPFTVYMSIEMYMSNILNNNISITKLSDDIIRDKHGFDKFSFRKDKC